MLGPGLRAVGVLSPRCNRGKRPFGVQRTLCVLVGSYGFAASGCRHYGSTAFFLAPRKLSHIRQEPLFPGARHSVKAFDGEYVYDYGRHTFTIIKESFTFAVIPLGCIVAYTATFFEPFAAVPVHFQGLYLALVLLASRLCARGRRHRCWKNLTNRHVIVTGGTSGIGRETAAQLAAMGADVTIVARKGPQVTSVLNYVRSFAPNKEQRILFTPLDLCDFIAVRDFCKRARQDSMRVDILVNNAALMHQKQMMSRFGDDEQLAGNLLGPYLLTEGLLPLVARSGGRVVYVSCSAHVAVRGNIVSTYLSGRGLWSPRIRGKFDGLEQYGFTKLGCIYHAQELAIRSYSRTTSAVALLTLDGGPVASLSRDKNGSGDACNSGMPSYTTCVAAPGAVITSLYRHVPLAITLRLFRYLYLLVMRSACDGSQAVVNCCVREELVNGGYYQNCRHTPSGLSAAACSASERKSVLAWVRRKMQPYMVWDP
ncbi:short chain dehydrogenase KR domain [Trypanosoma vivax]|uniref:Putative short chain dehydrogenase/reductase n=1 Tax=Trypanosoma vivax (strain Y486) TaxID=1055687 RepID=G0U1N7_TRYVY|nr:putative short chain dehydrogenase/reductase [Trypanosoma vivax]KAH8616963.1 short chain dehydrogenase KR domain [Trypanosoma vivax]CCC49994.1 putative short chain dehydrogenase/reductase [Trypanosoma vivax Y486]